MSRQIARLIAEDEPMLRGTARFIADLPVDDHTLHAVFVRSQFAHGENLRVDTELAAAAPGVVAVFCYADLAGADLAGVDLAGTDLAGNRAASEISFYPQITKDGLMARPLLARDKVRFVGEPVAVVLAESVAAAVDAAEQVVVEVDPLPAVPDVSSAINASAELLFPAAGSNIVIEPRTDWPRADWPRADSPASSPDPCEGADFIADLICENPRVASAPIEPCGILAISSDTGGVASDAASSNKSRTVADQLDIWCTGQGVQPMRAAFAASEGINLSTDSDQTDTRQTDTSQIRVRHPYVGGGFGGRGDVLVEFLVVVRCARLLGRPVCWVQTRAEQFFSLPYGRDQQHHIRLGITAAGDIVGLDATMWVNAGAYPHMAPLLAAASRRQCTGMYRIERFRYNYAAAVTNTPAVGAYRGAGQPEVNAALERAIDAAARLAGLDPNLVRRRNLLRPSDLPYDTRLGVIIDSGDPIAALEQALQAVDADRWQAEAIRRREQSTEPAQPGQTRLIGRLIGIGVGCYSQTAGSGDDGDYARLELDEEGVVHIGCASAGHGQGHHTAWARLASAALGITTEQIKVIDADTDVTAVGLSTGGSRSSFVLGSQISAAATQLKSQVATIAARLLEATPADIVVIDQGAHVAGVPASVVNWPDLVAAAEPGELSTTSTERIGGPTHPYGTHAAVVEVDAETGEVGLLAYAAVDDCGVVLEEESVIGQQHGGSVAGISQALMEAAIYDQQATPLTISFSDYLIPSATSLPSLQQFQTRRLEIPTDRNPLGARGIGENGAIAAPPAVQNAVVDALAHLGVVHIDIPLTPQRVWKAIAAVR